MIAKGHDIHGVTLVGVLGCGLRPRPARLPRRRARLPIANSGIRPRRTWRTPRPRPRSDLQLRPLRHPLRSRTRLPTASPKKSCNSGAGCTTRPSPTLANFIIQSPRLEEAAAWSATLGKWFERHPIRRRKNPRPSHRADQPPQAYLSLSLRDQSRETAGTRTNPSAPLSPRPRRSRFGYEVW